MQHSNGWSECAPVRDLSAEAQFESVLVLMGSHPETAAVQRGWDLPWSKGRSMGDPSLRLKNGCAQDDASKNGILLSLDCGMRLADSELDEAGED